MAEQIDSAHEERLMKAAGEATSLVESGLTPDDAVEKVAREHKFSRGDVESIAWAYNTGRQTGQWRSEGNILDKLASYPLADPEKVIASIWGAEAEKKSADRTPASVAGDYAVPPTWLTTNAQKERVQFLKQATMTEKTAAEAAFVPVPAHDDRRVHQYHKALGTVQREKQAVDELARIASSLVDKTVLGVGAVVDYFRKSASERLPFVEVEAACRTYIGPTAKPLLDVVYDRAKLAYWKEPRCPEKTPLFKRAFFQDDAPFTLIKAALDVTLQAVEARKALVAGREKLARTEEEAMRPFVRAGVPEKQDTSRAIAVDGHLWSTKAAGILGTPAVGAAFGTMIGRTIGNVPQSKDDMVENAWMDLEDPQHQNELRKIQAHTLLTGMMTDPEDPISGHDPDKVLKAYNEISQIAPRAAENSASLGPLLRRRLEGHTEPFEAKEMTDIEKGIAQTKGMTPDTNILGGTPSKLLA